jgi:hypothetical protein
MIPQQPENSELGEDIKSTDQRLNDPPSTSELAGERIPPSRGANSPHGQNDANTSQHEEVKVDVEGISDCSSTTCETIYIPSPELITALDILKFIKEAKRLSRATNLQEVSRNIENCDEIISKHLTLLTGFYNLLKPDSPVARVQPPSFISESQEVPYVISSQPKSSHKKIIVSSIGEIEEEKGSNEVDQQEDIHEQKVPI